jgi:hypothetical protein
MWVTAKCTNNGIIKNKRYQLVNNLDFGDKHWYLIIDELGRETYYSKKSFYSKSEIRDITISNFLG